MLTKTQEKLIEILRAELTGTDEANLSDLSEKELTDIYQLACKHNVYTMAGDYMFRHGVEWDQILWDMANAQEKLANMDKVLADVTKVLTEAKIPFLVLKGPEMRKFYPQPWMRLSGDIDVLLHEEDKSVFTRVVCDSLSYIYEKTPLEDHFITPEGVILDVSIQLDAPTVIDKDGTLYNDIWDYTTQKLEGSYITVLLEDMLYVYNVNHTAKHLRNGGCGIAHIMDLWVLNHCVAINQEIMQKRLELLEAKHIKAVDKELRMLSEKWFSNSLEKINPVLEEYILAGNALGTEESKLFSKTKGTLKYSYFLSRIFVPYDHLVVLFPELKGKRWLTPLYEVRRWLRQIKNGRTATILNEFSRLDQRKLETVQRTSQMLKNIGL